MEANGQSNARVVILAGGFGTRLAEKTDIIPKPMLEIGDKPILWHIMKIYAYFGFNEFIIALGYKGEILLPASPYKDSCSLEEVLFILYSKGYIKGEHINLDFHSIPHWGEQSQLEGHWVPTRRRRMKSVLTFFAQDLDTTYLCYSNANLSGKEATDEILNFVSFYKKANKLLPECLVFDSKLTTYKNLTRLNELGIRFITIKRRGKKILEEISKIKTWKNIRLQEGSRKHRSLKIHERFTSLRDYNGQVREIIVTGHGRELPTLTITNDFQLKAKRIISTCAHRWLIENNIAENVDFFNPNALASPVVVKVDFDVAMTLIANTLYKILSSKFKLFRNSKVKTTYHAFVEGGAAGEITDNEVRIEFKKRSFNPILMNWVSSLEEIKKINKRVYRIWVKK